MKEVALSVDRAVKAEMGRVKSSGPVRLLVRLSCHNGSCTGAWRRDAGITPAQYGLVWPRHARRYTPHLRQYQVIQVWDTRSRDILHGVLVG
jgi:hypothetical protein